MYWHQNLCRLCGQISEICHVIGKAVNSIDEDLRRYLDIDVTEDDHRPGQICDECHTTLKDFAKFYETCHKVDKRYEAIYQSPQNQEPTNRSNDGCEPARNPNLEAQVSKTALEHSPNYRIKTTKSSIQIQRVRLRQRCNKSPGAQCRGCQGRNTARRTQKGKLLCPLCTKTCSLLDYRPFQCDLCEKRFKSARYLKKHLERHSEKKGAIERLVSDFRFNCDVCEKRFKYKHALIGHMKRHKVCERNADDHTALFEQIKFCTTVLK